MKESVAVVGSLNQDLVMRSSTIPESGETLIGKEFNIFLGGKGNNQAIQAARAGAKTFMIGRVGNDPFGHELIATLEKNNVDHTYLIRDPETGTGVAMVIVDDKGNNSIVIAPRSNAKLTTSDIERARPAIEKSKVLLTQLEIPLDTVELACRLGSKSGCLVILNASPLPEKCELPPELLKQVDILVVNAIEAQKLTGFEVVDQISAPNAAQKLSSFGPKVVVITLAKKGALLFTEKQEPYMMPGFKVNTIDTTAAGDAFTGAFAAACASGNDLQRALKYACAAGALATTRLGAVPSLPTKQEIADLLNMETIHLDSIARITLR